MSDTVEKPEKNSELRATILDIEKRDPPLGKVLLDLLMRIKITEGAVDGDRASIGLLGERAVAGGAACRHTGRQPTCPECAGKLGIERTADGEWNCANCKYRWGGPIAIGEPPTPSGAILLCDHCRKNPAACFGFHPNNLPVYDGPALSCDDCCEGGLRCAPITGKEPVCERCEDTHMMPLGEERRAVMCTACPRPCRQCQDGSRPYCKATPCACACHGSPKAVTSAVERIVAARVRDEERQRAREGLGRVRDFIAKRVAHDYLAFCLCESVDAELDAIDAAVKKEAANG